MSDEVNGCPRCERFQHALNEAAKIRNQYFVDVRDLESRLAESQRKVEELEREEAEWLAGFRRDNSMIRHLEEENIKLKALMGEASSVIDELLTAEAEENNKKVKLVDGIKYYPITGRYRTNAAFYKLDEVLAKLQEASK